jgi:hypothetical protein
LAGGGEEAGVDFDESLSAAVTDEEGIVGVKTYKIDEERGTRLERRLLEQDGTTVARRGEDDGL